MKLVALRAQIAQAEGRLTMPAPHLMRGHYRYLASVVILLLGGAVALFVFLTASPQADADIVGYRLIGGQVFAVTISDSERTAQRLEANGSRLNLDAAELDAWIGSLWHGR